MIETLARAIHDAGKLKGSSLWDDRDEWMQDMYRKIAGDVVESIRIGGYKIVSTEQNIGVGLG